MLHFFTSCLGAQPRVRPPAFVVIPMPPFPQAEKLLLIVMHEFLHFILHVACSFALVIFVNNPRISSSHPLLSSSVPAFSDPADPSSAAPPLLGQLDVPTSLFSIMLVSSTRACRCVPVHLLRIVIPNCLALVTVPYTCCDKSWPSFIARSQPEHAQIRHCRSRSGHGHDLRHALHSRVNF